MTTGPASKDLLEVARKLQNNARSIVRLLESVEINEEDKERVLELIEKVDYSGLKKIIYPDEPYVVLRRKAQRLGVKNYSRLSYNELIEAIAYEEALSERIAEAQRNVRASVRALQKNKKGRCTGMPDQYM